MSSSYAIVSRLLEDEDEEEIDPKELVHSALDADQAARDQVRHQFNTGVINAETAQLGSGFYHRKLKYKGRGGKPGTEPIYARKSGRIKTWVTRPGEFRIPMKYGMYDNFYIDHTNAHEWSTIPNPPQAA